MSQSVGYLGDEGLTLPGRRLLLAVAVSLCSIVLGSGMVTARPSEDLKTGLVIVIPDAQGQTERGTRSTLKVEHDTASIVTASNATEKTPEPAPESPGTSKEIPVKDAAPMVLIPSGEFTMGSPDDEGGVDEHPQHRVSLDAFYLDTYEVTNTQYAKFLEETGRVMPEYWEQLDLSVHGAIPVVGVDWNQAQAYCEWAEKRLPTEAEWEYAGRGNDKRLYPWGNTDPTSHLANYGKPWSHKFFETRLEPVRSRGEAKSPYGLHHMAGNVWEWVADWYDEKYYERSPARKPPGPPTGNMKVVRGGSWNFASGYLRAASRFKFPPKHRAADLGLRCARDTR